MFLYKTVEEAESELTKRYVVPKHLVTKVIDNQHFSKFSGHLGVKKR